jgi:predicted secreted protein
VTQRTPLLVEIINHWMIVLAFVLVFCWQLQTEKDRVENQPQQSCPIDAEANRELITEAVEEAIKKFLKDEGQWNTAKPAIQLHMNR